MPRATIPGDIDQLAAGDQQLAARIATATTLLFVPGDRPERFEKAAAAGADLVVLDLEDAVPADRKDFAREQVCRWIASGHQCVVRVNAAGVAGSDPTAGGSSRSDSRLLRTDLDALARTMSATGDIVGRCAIMLPKSEDVGQLRRVAEAFTLAPMIIALVETARGVLNAAQLASTPGVKRLALGSFDLAAQLGVDPVDDDALAASRGALVLASAAAGLAGPIDGVTAAVDDAPRLTAHVAYARRLGFAGKLCIHPRQLPVVAAAFAPSAAERGWAQKIAAAVDLSGVAVIDGEMVDKPVVDRARRILAAVAPDSSRPS